MRAVCITLALLAFAVPAQAQIRMAASAGNLRYTISDLAPGDGVAPGSTFPGTVQAELSHALTVVKPDQPEMRWAGDLLVEAPAVINRDLDTSAHTGIAWDGRTLLAAGAVAPVAAGRVAFDEWASMPWTNFMLSPHTRIAFTLDAALGFTLDGGPGTQARGWGESWLELNHSVNNGAFGVVPPLADGESSWLGDDAFRDFNGSTEVARVLSVTWDNDSDYWEQGILGFDARVVGEAWGTPVTPVPEPDARVMLLIGSALLAWRRLASGRHGGDR